LSDHFFEYGNFSAYFFVGQQTNLSFNMTKEIIFTTKAPTPIGPYSQAVKVNGMLFVSGQVAFDPETNDLIVSDIEQETRRVMLNVGEILTAAGMSFQNIVKTTIFLKDMNNFGAVNTVYGQFFADHFPARETVEVARLPKDVNVEISVIAV
jgi:2-iminobutanoate/2-iminopropanoate deaminase